jgi:Putative prokaryotic signal transducing protein
MENMEQTNDQRIVVYTNYPTVIEANLAKTKLDAYGIPCFLSDENLANLYPLSYFNAGQVRLHIFEEDLARVKEVLEEENSK